MPNALQIAEAGLEHWRAGSGARAQEFFDGAIAAMNDPKLQREFIHSSPAGVTDTRWAEIISRTCIFAIYSERDAAGAMPDIFSFTRIDAYACKCAQHSPPRSAPAPTYRGCTISREHSTLQTILSTQV